MTVENLHEAIAIVVNGILCARSHRNLGRWNDSYDPLSA
jgi:hypothetical protein